MATWIEKDSETVFRTIYTQNGRAEVCMPQEHHPSLSVYPITFLLPVSGWSDSSPPRYPSQWDSDCLNNRYRTDRNKSSLHPPICLKFWQIVITGETERDQQ